MPQNNDPYASIAQPSAASDPYAAIAESASAPPPVPQATVSAAPGSMPNDSLGSKLANWAQNVQNDLKYGTDTTVVGHVLKALGAHGLYSGNPQVVGDFMGSFPLGLAKMAQGEGQIFSGQPRQGAENLAGGTLQAAAIPGSIIAPEGTGTAVDAVVSKTSPAAMKEAAAGLLQSVAHDANKIPVKFDNSGDAALDLMKWQQKTQLGPTINKYLNRITNPKKGPLTYEEARDYYQLLGKLSSDETSKLAPPVRRDLVRMVVGLKQDIGNAADQAGRAADYYKGMRDYATAAKHQQWYDAAKEWGIRAGLGALGYEGLKTAWNAWEKAK